MFSYKTLDIYTISRELSSKNYYQTIYANAKEIGIKLFENDTGLTEIQIYFLNYLNYYQNLNTDIILGDVNEIVRDNFIFEDAYMLYKRKNKNTPGFPKDEKPSGKNREQTKEVVKTTSHFVFRRQPEGE